MNTVTPVADTTPINVAFTLSAVGARAVSVAFFFNQWSAELPPPERPNDDEPQHKDHLMVRALVSLEQVKPGLWHCETPLAPGWHEYLFLVDGVWVMDPDAPEICADYSGGFNAARMVERAPAPARIRRPAARVRESRRPALRRAG